MVRVTVVVLLVLLGLGPRAQAQPVAQSVDSEILAAFAKELRRSHISGRPLDAGVSRQCFQNFLDSLDPRKAFFEQTDVDRLGKQRDRIGEMVSTGDAAFAYETFRVFLRCVDQRLGLADELLAARHDFTVDESVAVDSRLFRYARNAAEIRDNWRRRIKYDLLELKTGGIEGTAAVEALRSRYREFGQRMHATDRDGLLEAYLTALGQALDPQTGYLSPTTLAGFRTGPLRPPVGIGVQLRLADGYTEIGEISAGSPAEQAGELRARDRIAAVATTDTATFADALMMSPANVHRQILGRSGTVVLLKAITPAFQWKTIRIERREREPKPGDLPYEVFNVGSRDGTPVAIGVVDLSRPYWTSLDPDAFSLVKELERVLQEFKAKKADAVVLDLRRAPLSSAGQAMALAGLFLGPGLFLQVRERQEQPELHQCDRQATWNGPLVVVTSQQTRRAAEWLAAGLQDHRRALVVGDGSTAGEGMLPAMFQLRRNDVASEPAPHEFGVAKITGWAVYRLDGTGIHGRGVSADIELPSLTNQPDHRQSEPSGDRVGAVPFNPRHNVDRAIVGRLVPLSAERRQKSPWFQQLAKAAAWSRQWAARQNVPLNEQAFMAERAAWIGGEKTLREVGSHAVGESPSAVSRDPYLEEVLAVTVDYVQILRLGS